MFSLISMATYYRQSLGPPSVQGYSHIPPHGNWPPSLSREQELVLDQELQAKKAIEHSTRAAASFAAHMKDASISEVMSAVGWSRSRTFERFYHKEIAYNFSEAVFKDN